MMSTVTSRKRELMTWHFALFTVIWYNIFYQINHVSKIVQSPSVSVETLQQETSTVRVYLEGFRENGLAASETYANEIVENQKTKSNLAVPV